MRGSLAMKSVATLPALLMASLSLKMILMKRKDIVMRMIWYVVSVTLIFCTACSMATKTGYEIPEPELLFRDPDLDFTKTRALCIFPITATGSEVSEISDSFNASIAQTISAQHPGWKVISPMELYQFINQHNLGRPYQNYIADFNTWGVFSETPGQRVFSGETRNFFRDLKKLECDTLLFSSYSESTKRFEEDPDEFYNVVSIASSLYFVDDDQTWWFARITVMGYGGNLSLEGKLVGKIFGKKKEPIKSLADKAIQSIAQNLGKGTLRQL